MSARPRRPVRGSLGAMSGPSARFQLPNGTEIEAGSDTIVGRSPVAAIRIDDARLSTVHAELSWRAGGFQLIARGGRLLVGGRGVREVTLTPGLAVDLVPGVSLRVLAVSAGSAPVVPPTAGRDRLRIVSGPNVSITAGDLAVTLSGVPARIVGHLLGHPRGAPWEDVARSVWPDEGALRAATLAGTAGRDRWTDVDERRFRNRLDQQITATRRQLSAIRDGLVLVQGGVVSLALAEGDVIEPA
jgi:hypothetical protein